MPCLRCNIPGGCGCSVVAGKGMTVTGDGTALSPWVISAAIPSPIPSLVIFDGANGSTAPAISGGKFMLCSPSGGGVPGAPSQAAADHPTCPDITLPSTYQTIGGLRSQPQKKTTATTFIGSSANQWWVSQVPPLAQNTMIRGNKSLVVTNNECWPMQYFVQAMYHIAQNISSSPVPMVVTSDLHLVVNGVTGQRMNHTMISIMPFGASFSGGDYDIETSNLIVSAGILAPGAAMTIQIDRHLIVTGAAAPGSGSDLDVEYCSLWVRGIPL